MNCCRDPETLKLKAEGEQQTPRPKKQWSLAFRSVARALKLEPEVLSGADRGWEGIAITGDGRICADPAAGL
jgi:hypothetical protein